MLQPSTTVCLGGVKLSRRNDALNASDYWEQQMANVLDLRTRNVQAWVIT